MVHLRPILAAHTAANGPPAAPSHDLQPTQSDLPKPTCGPESCAHTASTAQWQTTLQAAVALSAWKARGVLRRASAPVAVPRAACLCPAWWAQARRISMHKYAGRDQLLMPACPCPAWWAQERQMSMQAWFNSLCLFALVLRGWREERNVGAAMWSARLMNPASSGKPVHQHSAFVWFLLLYGF
eukprot:1159743-Pelagomonas_calceolata.AAC.10